MNERDAKGWIQVRTERGTIRAKTVVHTTNRWASHLLPEFEKLILPVRGTVNAIKAPPGFLKHTGAQHWDNTVNVSIVIRSDMRSDIEVDDRTTTSSYLRPSTLSYSEAPDRLSSTPQTR